MNTATRIATATIPGRASGTTIRVRTSIRPAPSTRAASIRSCGILRKKPMRMTVANDTVATAFTRATPSRLLISPSDRNIANSGTMRTSVGMISGARIRTKSSAAARRSQARQRVGGADREGEHQADRQGGHERRVREGEAQLSAVPRLAEVPQCRRPRQVPRRAVDVGAGHGRRWRASRGPGRARRAPGRRSAPWRAAGGEARSPANRHPLTASARGLSRRYSISGQQRG